MKRATEYVKSNPTAIVVVIIVLAILVGYFAVAYRGVASFGPFVASKTEKTKLDELAGKINNSR